MNLDENIKIKIKQATKDGYIVCCNGGVADFPILVVNLGVAEYKVVVISVQPLQQQEDCVG